MSLPGFDVSHYQAPVDFAAAKSAGMAFVVLKATESTNYADITCNGGWDPIRKVQVPSSRAAAHAAGLTVGLYHFARVNDPLAEAAWFCQNVGTLAPGEFLVLDWEVSASNPVPWCLSWLTRVTATLGVKPLIYMNQSTRDANNWSPVVAGGFGLWLAKYDNSPAKPTGGVWPTVAMKQYSSSGVVPGVNGGCDVDAFYGDAAALAALGSPNPAGADMTPQEHAQLQAVNDALASLVVKVSNPKTGLFDQVVSLRSQVSDLAAAVAKIQAGGATIDYAQLAKAVNDDAAKRLAS